MAQNFKIKVLTLITKLSDRDTYTGAAAELNSIAAGLDGSTLHTFLSCILSTDSTDKPLVRKQCLHLLATLAVLHANSLSTSLPKILSYIARRLRDSDSSIRTQCVTTVSSLSSKVTKPAFSTGFLKPLSESVFTEQDSGAQIGSALCLAAAIDGAPDPDPGRLGRAMLPRLERLLKSEAYKAKSAGLVVMGSVIGVGGVRGYAAVEGLVKCLVGFLSSEDWAARKAAAEALVRLAIVERDAMVEFKGGCLKVFENRRFDKVKAAREVMSQMIEAWKQVPDVSEEASPPPRSMDSSKEDASDGRYLSGSKSSYRAGSVASQARKRIGASSRTPESSETAAKMRGALRSSEKKTGTARFQKADSKKPLDWKVEIPVPSSNDRKVNNENVPEKRFAKLEAKRALFGKTSDDKTLKFGAKSGSRVAPCREESADSTLVASARSENHHINHKECEDLSSIRSQLVQIERQQSSLLDLLQRFMGSSQNGMHSLETRVHGLELALDEISYDLALSNGRMTNATDYCRTTCCRIPGADFLSSKFWRKTESRYSASRLSSRGVTSSLFAMRRQVDKNCNAGNLEDRSRLRLQGGRGLIVNPLAEIHAE